MPVHALRRFTRMLTKLRMAEPGDGAAGIVRTFKDIDTDGSGGITFAEFIAHMSAADH